MNDNDGKLGLGLVGTGMGSLVMAINHDPTADIRVRGIYEPDFKRQHQRYAVGKKLKELAAEYKVEFLTADYAALLARNDIDCIGIFSPCPNHFEQIKAALLAGKHVMVTKPMVVSLEEAREIVRLADQTGLKLMVAQSMRWNGMFVAIHDLVASGKIGRIMLAEAYYVHDMRPVMDASPWRYQMPQDLIYGGVCHPADLLRWCLGEVDEVFAYGTHGGLDMRYPEDKPDNFVISLRYRNGVIARILEAHSVVHAPNLWRLGSFHGVGIGLYGTGASLFNDRIVYDYYGTGKPPVEEKVEPAGNSTDHAGEVLAFTRHFADCILNDRKPLVDVRDGAQIIAICDACWESIRTGKPVKVSREFDNAKI
ncbi:MAG: Gfo/Idh/MocA family oxidoreductase [Lentisphaerota bacterium]